MEEPKPKEEKVVYTSEPISFPAHSPELVRWQLSSEDIIDELEHDLRGEVFNPQTELWEKKGSRLMNEEGIKLLSHLARVNVNKVVFLSNLDGDEINKMVKDLADGLVSLFLVKHKEFEIRKETLPILHTMVCNFILSGLKRAENQGEREFLKTTQRMVERVTTSSEAEERKKFLGLF